jgi:acetyltransferase-like isoleucine patch superfamily enzyme
MRDALKRVAFGIALALVSPLLLIAWLEKRLAAGDTVFAACSQLLSLVPGPIGVQFRAAFYYGALDRCSWEIHVGFGSIFTHRAATLAPHVSMGAFCVIGHADIGAGVRMASRVSIPSGKRQHCDEMGAPVPASHFERVLVGAGSWIGEGAIVMANVDARCVVGAGAVVTRPVPPACLVAGNPADVVKLFMPGRPPLPNERIATP